MNNIPIIRNIKLLITHQNPDLDAIGACWLLMKFETVHFGETQLYFVSAGDEIAEDVLAAKELGREEVVHVDTGLGPFDHHQQDNKRRDSASLRVYEYLITQKPDIKSDEALKRMVDFINDVDHFAGCYWPEATNDRYGFMLEEILKGLRGGRQFNDREMVEFGSMCLDGVYAAMTVKVRAETEIVKLGTEFKCPWGKALAIENKNDEVVKQAQKQGFMLVVRKDKESGHVRIKGVPEKGIDLTKLYQEITRVDKTGTWYLHPSKTMLLNGSSRNDKHVATPLKLKEVVEIIRSQKIIAVGS
jgi:hypothetical protein